MSPVVADPPLRQLTRLRSEFSIAATQLAASLFSGRPLVSLEFGIVSRVCLPDWIQDGVIAPPAVPVNAITVRRIAQSLGGSAETVRRHVNNLLDQGIFVALPHGIALGDTPQARSAAIRNFTGIHDLFLRMVEDLHYTSDYFLSPVTPAVVSMLDLLERAADTLLMTVDSYAIRGISRNGLMLWAGLTNVAVRDVTYDPVLARRYANEIPPDSVRLGISLRRIAAALSMPYATAWRQIEALTAAGLVSRLPNGDWTVLAHNLQHADIRAISTSPSVFLANKLRDLAMLGLNPADIPARYITGRPPIADLGLAVS
ncbi:hypothetical protein [Sphingomonas sp. LT1P40]|uniref:hypothetical protein n=1 Tax=Alteristakelama amylovorans TaxID=3096166 RepID=UPI002FC90966